MHKKSVVIAGAFLLLAGGLLGYYSCNTEPWETIGGVICGIGFALTFLSLSSIKTNKK